MVVRQLDSTYPLIGVVSGWFGAAVAAIVLGLVMAFSPTVFTLEIGALSAARSPRRIAAIVAASAVTGSTLLLIVLQLVSPGTFDSLWRGSVEPLLLQRGVDLVVGTVIVITGVVQWNRGRRTPAPATTSRHELDRPRVLAGLVLVNTVAGSTALATVYLTIRTVDAAVQAWWGRALIYLVFLATVALPYLALGWAWVRMPDLTRHLESWTHRIASHDWRRHIGAGLIVVGALIVLAALTGHPTARGA